LCKWHPVSSARRHLCAARTIDATPSGGTSTLTLNGSGGVTNTGTLEATGGGTLSVTAGTITNNGLVAALDNSAVTYRSGATNVRPTSI
jgi:hypothetical protein